jgi:hypothetical protein
MMGANDGDNPGNPTYDVDVHQRREMSTRVKGRYHEKPPFRLAVL